MQQQVRTPLNSLSLGIEVLASCKVLNAECPENHDIGETLKAMTEAVSFMSETLDDILSLQKIEEGKFELNMGPVSIRAVLQKLESVFKGGLSSKGLTLLVDVAQDFPSYILGDRNRLEHVAANLLSNAIKFTKERTTIKIHVKTALVKDSHGEEKPMVDFSIDDQGCGLSQADKNKLFVEFSQIKPNFLQNGKGSGLGLSFCKQIIRLHGGSVGVDSVEGKGSTFSFLIPLHEAEAPVKVPASAEAARRASVAHAQGPPRPQLALEAPFGERAELKSEATNQAQAHNETAGHEAAEQEADEALVVPRLSVLVVDDAASNRKMLGMLLARAGVKDVAFAENGTQAVQAALVDPARFKVVFMDNIMSEV
jgi:CheY-like chemotaxis protein